MHKLLAVIFIATLVGCTDETDPYDINPTPGGDNPTQGDSAAGDPGSGGDTAAGDPGGGGDSGLPVFTLNIQETCPTLTPCGGDVVGTWVVTDVCVEEVVLFDALYGVCIDAAVTDIPEAPASGVVTFTSTTVQRYATAAITADIVLPSTCGHKCMCSGVETLLNLAELNATCNATCNKDDECECTIVASLLIDEAGTYTVNGNTITTSDGSTFDYCIDANGFKYIDTTVTDPEPGLYTLSPQ